MLCLFRKTISKVTSLQISLKKRECFDFNHSLGNATGLEPRTTSFINKHSPIWPNWVKSSCSHLNFRFLVCFEEGTPWHSGNFRVWIQSETHTWHDKNIQSTLYGVCPILCIRVRHLVPVYHLSLVICYPCSSLKKSYVNVGCVTISSSLQIIIHMNSCSFL